MPQEDQPHQPEPQHYPELLTRPEGSLTEVLQPTAEQLLHTPEGYLEVEQESRELQQALALDFNIWASELPDDVLQSWAKTQIDALNEKRNGDPVHLATASRQFLQHLIRPEWNKYFPTDDSEAEQTKWKTFLKQWPDHIQGNLEELLQVDGELHKQTTDLDLMREVTGMRQERLELMRSASGYLGAERTLTKLSTRAVTIRSQAALSNRSLTRHEKKQLESIGQHQDDARERQNSLLTSGEVVTELELRKALQDSRDLDKGILLTDQMKEKINYVLSSLMSGKPVLLVGETGGAKTALAEFISHEYFGVEPEFISGHAEINSYQLVGKTNLKSADHYTEEELTATMGQIAKEGGQDYATLPAETMKVIRQQALERLKARTGTVSTFDSGPMLRAMEEGKPLILDEINAIPPDFMKRLNKIMQLRPGDTYTPQEDSGLQIKIKQGFCIIGTANEKSKRYKGVDDLSVELQNRFGANVVRMGYPDAETADGQVPKDNLRLALAYLRDRTGAIDPAINLTEIGSFVRAAHVTQKLFTGSDIPTYVSSDVVRDGLKEAVIAPRTMIDILAKVKEGHPLTETLSHFVSGFKNEGDRKALGAILRHHGFDLEAS